ncbi:probable receptor-like protein kinase At5g18500 [Morus notabilis]|uniref:probable receptor-like protein kinase At5g18500 n=1 Tax=Morus notabilis TaxID=981085 RepID=UPI000CED26E6|nr:probable receptor-like protein kinase At5g18500 [Morus notabilis]
MDMLTLNCHKLDMTKHVTKLTFILFFFLLIFAVEFAVSKPYSGGCSLSFNLSTTLFSSNCEGGDWGGFLQKSCCGAAFDEYLYALGQRANRTGKVFLNSTEQSSCLVSLAKFHGNISGCGIEKLVSGIGGCSDFSVADVTDKFGDELRSLNEKCELQSSVGTWEKACDSCAEGWEDIKGIHSSSSKIENDICRFAVMVSFTSSRIDDTRYFSLFSRCLGEHIIKSGNEELKHSRKTNISKGGLIGVAVIVLISAWLLYRRCIRSTGLTKTDAFKDVLTKEPGCPKVPIKEVYSATNNLSETNLIGEGNAGKVYKGMLSNKQPVAIKHIVDDEDIETFVREVTSLSRIRHPNLVSLLGYCFREDDCFLVYELCPNGNLSEWLFGKDKVLSWIQRLEIAVDSARALRFLHTYSEGCIVHRDIKPTNILLGENFQAKLSDFGLSKVIDLGETYASSEVRGTFGYVDPDYRSNRRVKSSGDVYSFGVVLLQIISGKKVINMNMQRPMPLNKMAKVITKGGNITEFADPKLEGEYSTEAFGLILELALSCTALKRQRPSMEQIVAKLQEALDKSTNAKASTPQTTPHRNA